MLDTIFGATPAIRAFQSGAARALHRIGVSADVATIAAAIIGVMAGVAFAANMVIVGIVLLAMSAILDALDGTIAREFGGSPSPFGGVMDLSFDRVVEAAVLIG